MHMTLHTDTHSSRTLSSHMYNMHADCQLSGFTQSKCTWSVQTFRKYLTVFAGARNIIQLDIQVIGSMETRRFQGGGCTFFRNVQRTRKHRVSNSTIINLDTGDHVTSHVPVPFSFPQLNFEQWNACSNKLCSSQFLYSYSCFTDLRYILPTL